MKQIRIILLISITLACGRGYAQIGNHIPQYAACYHPLNGRYNGTYSNYANLGQFNSTKQFVNACIYPSGSFAAPAGKITHIYVAGNSLWSYYAGSNYYTPIPMRMGQTALRNFDTFFTPPSQLPDTTAAKAFLYSLPKVSFTDSVLCIDSAIFPFFSDMYPPHNQGIWVKIKLDHPIPYDPTKSLVIAGDIDVAYGEGSVKGGILIGVRYTEDSSADYPNFGGKKDIQHNYALNVRRDTLTGKISSMGVGKVYMDLGFDIEPLSVSELYAQQHVHRAYPNPAADKLTIEGIERVGAYQVYDLMGRKALQGNTAGDAIPVNTLPPGMYLLRFMQGAVQQQIKFMKE